MKPRLARTAFGRRDGRTFKVVQCWMCLAWMDPSIEGYYRDEAMQRVASGTMSDPLATGLNDVTICSSCEEG